MIVRGEVTIRLKAVGRSEVNGLDLNLLLHAPEDDAGVAIAEIRAGEKARGLILSDRSAVEVDAVDDIPLGHKIAVKAVSRGDRLLLYGHPVGVATRTIKPGEHVHTHNVKSLRWS